MIPTTLTQSLVYLGLAWWVARRWGWTSADPAVLAASRGLVYRFPSAQPPALRVNGRGRTLGVWCNWQHDWFWSS